MLNLIGQQFGHYQILEELGRGGMAVVFKAYQPSLNRCVALKVLPSHYQDDAELLARFRREAEATRALLHPNIVRVFEVGEAQGMPFIAMEYVEGGSVAQEMARRRGPLDVATATGIAAQVAAALDSAHRQGVIHRDVKPSNILLAGDGRALLSDFGIAKKAGKTTLTQKGTLLGTPAYMSPEQARGRRNLDGRSDIYSLGIVLYEMLTGDVPFHGDDPTVILRAILDDAPPPPSWLNPSIPPALERIVLRALAKQPEQRYATAGEMLAALQAAATAGAAFMRPRVAASAATRSPAKSRPDPLPVPVLLGIAGLAIVLVAIVALAMRGFGARPLQATPTLTLASPTQVTTVTTAGDILPTSTLAGVPATSTALPAPSPTAVPAKTTRPPSTVLAPAPRLVSPRDGESWNSKFVGLSWIWAGTLATNNYYDVRVWKEGQPNYGIGWTQDAATPFYFRPGAGQGKYCWQIVVIRQTGANPNGTKIWEPISEESETRCFEYTYSPPEPTNPPPPEPTNPPPPEPK